METPAVIGQFVRARREAAGLTQQQLADRCRVSYQYLSGIENGRENVTVGVLEAIAGALGITLPALMFEAAYGEGSPSPPPKVNPGCFRPAVPLPPGLTRDALAAALNETQRLIHLINANLSSAGGRPLPQYIQGNNFSGIVSNLLSDSLNRLSVYRHHSPRAFPDLTYDDREGERVRGLEVKATVKVGKGGESHNGHGGWHLVGCFRIDPATGDILFVHVMLADLVGHAAAPSDWKYVGSKVNEETGSQRTETYVTTLRGTTKLRDGSVYLDPDAVDHRRWKQERDGDPPPHSIFFRPPRAE
jgi:transcriptional regulator with XRE-family HTH domain